MRPKLCQRLLARLRSGARIALLGGPRLGKTRLIEAAVEAIPEISVADGLVDWSDALQLAAVDPDAAVPAGVQRFPLQVLGVEAGAAFLRQRWPAWDAARCRAWSAEVLGHPALLDALTESGPGSLAASAAEIYEAALAPLAPAPRALLAALIDAGRPLSLAELPPQLNLKRHADRLVLSGLCDRRIVGDRAALDASAGLLRAWWVDRGASDRHNSAP